MGKASRTKRERRESGVEDSVKAARRAWNALSDEEKKEVEALQEQLKADAEAYLTPFVTMCNNMKADKVAKAAVGHNDDITPMVELYRGDDLVATVICRDVDRDQGLNAIYALTPAMCIDRVTMAVDAHVSNRMTDPRTGKPWAPNAMQNFCNEEGACDLGLITDCIHVLHIRKDGTQYWASSTYHVHHTTVEKPGEVVWVTNEDEMPLPRYMGGNSFTPGQLMTGFVPDTIKAALELPTFDERLEEIAEDDDRREVIESMKKLAEGLPETEMWAHRDCGIVKGFMAAKPGEYAVMLASNDPVRTEILKHSFEDESLVNDLLGLRARLDVTHVGAEDRGVDAAAPNPKAPDPRIPVPNREYRRHPQDRTAFDDYQAFDEAEKRLGMR